MFSVVGGPCTVDSSGCVMSPSHSCMWWPPARRAVERVGFGYPLSHMEMEVDGMVPLKLEDDFPVTTRGELHFHLMCPECRW